jgi:hypothetical protein
MLTMVFIWRRAYRRLAFHSLHIDKCFRCSVVNIHFYFYKKTHKKVIFKTRPNGFPLDMPLNDARKLSETKQLKEERFFLDMTNRR